MSRLMHHIHPEFSYNAYSFAFHYRYWSWMILTTETHTVHEWLQCEHQSAGQTYKNPPAHWPDVTRCVSYNCTRQHRISDVKRKLWSIDGFYDSLNSSRCGWHSDISLEKMERKKRLLPSWKSAAFCSRCIQVGRKILMHDSIHPKKKVLCIPKWTHLSVWQSSKYLTCSLEVVSLNLGCTVITTEIVIIFLITFR